jgi:hypothetical protein
MLLGNQPLTNRNTSYIKVFGICIYPSPRATGGDRTQDLSVTRHDSYRYASKLYLFSLGKVKIFTYYIYTKHNYIFVIFIIITEFASSVVAYSIYRYIMMLVFGIYISWHHDDFIYHCFMMLWSHISLHYDDNVIAYMTTLWW